MRADLPVGPEGVGSTVQPSTGCRAHCSLVGEGDRYVGSSLQLLVPGAQGGAALRQSFSCSRKLTLWPISGFPSRELGFVTELEASQQKGLVRLGPSPIFSG